MAHLPTKTILKQYKSNTKAILKPLIKQSKEYSSRYERGGAINQPGPIIFFLLCRGKREKREEKEEKEKRRERKEREEKREREKRRERQKQRSPEVY